MTKAEREIKQEAQRMLDAGVTAADFSHHYFGPDGQLPRMATSRAERDALIRSPLYRWLQKQLSDLRLRDAEFFEQDLEAASGRVTIIIPKSLHAALKLEAKQEGVSLSELMRAKLTVRLGQGLARQRVGRRS